MDINKISERVAGSFFRQAARGTEVFPSIEASLTRLGFKTKTGRGLVMEKEWVPEEMIAVRLTYTANMVAGGKLSGKLEANVFDVGSLDFRLRHNIDWTKSEVISLVDKTFKRPKFNQDVPRFVKALTSEMKGLIAAIDRKVKEREESVNLVIKRNKELNDHQFNAIRMVLNKKKHDLTTAYKDLGVTVDISPREDTRKEMRGFRFLVIAKAVSASIPHEIFAMVNRRNIIELQWGNGWAVSDPWPFRDAKELSKNIGPSYIKWFDELVVATQKRQEEQEAKIQSAKVDKAMESLEEHMFDSLEGSDYIMDNPRDLKDEAASFEKAFNLPEGSVSSLDVRSALKSLARSGKAYSEGNGWSSLSSQKSDDDYDDDYDDEDYDEDN